MNLLNLSTRGYAASSDLYQPQRDDMAKNDVT